MNKQEAVPVRWDQSHELENESLQQEAVSIQSVQSQKRIAVYNGRLIQYGRVGPRKEQRPTTAGCSSTVGSVLEENSSLQRDKRLNGQKEVLVLNRQGTQPQRPESPTVTPPGMRVHAGYINSTKCTSSTQAL